MSVQITINGADAAETVRELSALASHFLPSGAVPAASEPKKDTRKGSTTKPVETLKPDPEPEDKKDDDSDGDQKAHSDEDTPVPTVVELRASAQEKGKTAEGKKAIKALLDKFECKSISDVPEESRAAFLAELEAL